MFIDTRLGGATEYYLTPPEDAGMRLPDEVRKSVVFIVKETPAGGNTTIGTGFLVRVLSKQIGAMVIAFPYLVTAKHTAAKLPKDRRWGFKTRLKTGEPAILWCHPNSWVYHPTEPDNVDAAILPFNFPKADDDEVDFDRRFINVNNFLTDDVIKKCKIGTGDEIHIVGLFTRLPEEPIVRTGTIASIPTERVPGIKIGPNDPVDADVYLAEVRSLGGLSGSPVWVRETIHVAHMVYYPVTNEEEVRQVHGTGHLYFMGLMHGHWKIMPEEHDRVDFQTTQEEGSIALGLSVVVPAKKILEIINHPEQVEKRANAEKELQQTTYTD